MTLQDLPDVWSDTLKELELGGGASRSPTGRHEPWYGALMRFAHRGFFLVFLRADTERSGQQQQVVEMRVEMAHPEIKFALFASQLVERLEALGCTQVSASQVDGTPTLIDARCGAAFSNPEPIRALLRLLRETSEFITQHDAKSPPPSPFEGVSQQTESPSGSTQGVFESIGASEPAPQSAPEVAAASQGVVPRQKEEERAPEQGASQHHGAPSFDQVRVHVRDDHVALQASFTSAPEAMNRGLVYQLRTRFDASVEADDLDSAHLEARLRPAMTTATRRDVEELGEEVERYISKLQKFDDLGIGLDVILGVSATSSHASAPRRQSEFRVTRADIPSRRNQAPQEGGSEGVVLGLSPQPPGGDAERSGTTLRVGDFTDERLRREDAQGPIVDVVLRHPGYSDRNMAKVLTLLLSVEYSQALALIERAPCVIAWSVGREHAERLKQVVEQTGGARADGRTGRVRRGPLERLIPLPSRCRVAPRDGHHLPLLRARTRAGIAPL